MSSMRDRVGYLAFFVIGAGALWMSLDFVVESAIFPRIVAGTMAVMAALHLVGSFRPGQAASPDAEADSSGGYQLEASDTFFDDPIRFGIIFLLSLFYCIGVGAIGYYSSTALLVPIAALALGFRNLPAILISTLGYVVVTYIIINVIFARTLPPELLLQFIG